MANKTKDTAGGTGVMDRPAETPKLKPKEGSSTTDANGQHILIETEHAEDKALMDLAHEVREHDLKRSKAQAKATEAREKLAKLMKANKIIRYKRGDVDITLTETEKVSVKIPETNEGK